MIYRILLCFAILFFMASCSLLGLKDPLDDTGPITSVDPIKENDKTIVLVNDAANAKKGLIFFSVLQVNTDPVLPLTYSVILERLDKKDADVVISSSVCSSSSFENVLSITEITKIQTKLCGSLFVDTVETGTYRMKEVSISLYADNKTTQERYFFSSQVLLAMDSIYIKPNSVSYLGRTYLHGVDFNSVPGSGSNIPIPYRLILKAINSKYSIDMDLINSIYPSLKVLDAVNFSAKYSRKLSMINSVMKTNLPKTLNFGQQNTGLPPVSLE